VASQNPDDLKFPLAQLSDDPILLSQPSTSRQHFRDEAKNFKHWVQPRSDSDPQQLSLTSLTSLQSNARTLVIVLEAEAMLTRGHQVVFEECFENTNEGHFCAVSYNIFEIWCWDFEEWYISL
jgi:hypothetical protein